ncbi:hypothetical protein NVP1225O_24 [Vibrio phage 1.225.O._10N.261.48.B7]|nr:hypothetical protein NVP1225O_24 [Vibrio phage 1.225.O._10N.261.48.B7]
MRDSFERKVGVALAEWGWKKDVEEGMIMLLELMVKTQRGCYNSHTETGFLNSMKVMTKSGFPNKLGREFMMHMLYASSNQRPPAFKLMEKHRS